MNDLISRQAAIKTAIEWYDTHFRDGESVAGLATGLKNLPSAQRTGHWEEREVTDEKCIEEWQSARCSVCGKYHTTPYMYYFDNYKYCPNCGAKMEVEHNGIQ